MSNYPGEERLSDRAERACPDAFYRTVGIDYERSVLEMTYAYPSSQAWLFGDRLILCIVHGPNSEKLTQGVDGSRH